MGKATPMPLKPASQLRAEAREEHGEVLQAARRFAQRAAKQFEATAVYLFGSRARDDWRRGSDADLLVVSNHFAGMSQYERALVLSYLWDGPVGCEAMGATPGEFEQGRYRAGIVSMAIEDGMLQLWPAERAVTAG